MGLTLRQWRRLKEMSQQELADKLNVHVNTIIRYEQNPDSVTIGMAKEIADALGVPIEDIFLP